MPTLVAKFKLRPAPLIGIVMQFSRLVRMISENQKIARLKFRLVIELVRLRRRKKEALLKFIVRRHKLVPIFPNFKIQVRPVIKPSSAQMLIVDEESQRLDQMQRTPRIDAHTPDGTGVCVDLRIY